MKIIKMMTKIMVIPVKISLILAVLLGMLGFYLWVLLCAAAIW